MRTYRKWRDIVIEQLAADWAAALDYIQFAMEEYQVDGDTEVFLLALYTFVESQGGVEKLAKRTGIDTETLSNILSSENAPRVDTLRTILNAFGCRLSIVPLEGEEGTLELKPTREMASSKFSNVQTQLTEPDSSQ